MSTNRWASGICIAVPLAWASQATASVTVCNSRAEPMTAAVALGAMDPPGVSTGGHLGVTVEGWWRLSPGECATASGANANENWLYFHAHGKGSRLEGSARLCVRTKQFTSRQQFLMRDEVCKGDWREAGFVRQQSSAKNYRFTIK